MKDKIRRNFLVLVLIFMVWVAYIFKTFLDMDSHNLLFINVIIAVLNLLVFFKIGICKNNDNYLYGAIIAGTIVFLIVWFNGTVMPDLILNLISMVTLTWSILDINIE